MSTGTPEPAGPAEAPSAAAPADPAADEIVLRRDGARVDIVLNRPSRHNAMTTGMYAALTDEFTRLAHDSSVRVVVVRAPAGRLSPRATTSPALRA